MKDVVVTFKVSEQLAHTLSCIPNKSAFIRDALLSATEQKCPLCAGSGLTLHNNHIKEFIKNHTISHCHSCAEVLITCNSKNKKHMLIKQ